MFARSSDTIEVWRTWRDLSLYFPFWNSVLPVGDGLHSLQQSIYGVVIARATSVVLRLCPRPQKCKFSIWSFQLSFTVLELLLLPVYDSYYLFPLFHYVAQRRSHCLCVRRPQKYMFSIWNFSFIFYCFGVITSSGLWLLSTSDVPIRRATSIVLWLYPATTKKYV
jgi:hypothetical protein